ncbi:MAG TPA: exonuclease domain-containing protein [Candidatus Omnitrophota bacterium]|nr:exonuclease domain-containing protein [Candidatus Omnitrophota bacterium]
MKIQNALVSLDIESTGVWVEKDKIIEIALVKFSPDGKKETYYKRVNPGINIPKIVTDLTGISNQEVKNAPAFRDVAHEILSFIGSADLAGFNVERFDLPLLEREFADIGIKFTWEDRKVYDAQKIFHLNEKRDLSAAYQFYCGKELVGAHGALADSEAVFEILEKQVDKYGEGQEDISVLDKFEYSSHMNFYDAERKFGWWNGKLYPMFGKYRRQVSLDELVRKDPGYLKWLLTMDFKDDVKTLVKSALKGEIPARTGLKSEHKANIIPLK